MLNVNDYFQVAMRSGKMHSECGGPECAGHLPFERQATANGSFTIRPTGTTDPEPPDDILKRDGSMQVVKLPPVWTFETTRCALIQIRNSCKTSG